MRDNMRDIMRDNECEMDNYLFDELELYGYTEEEINEIFED